MQKYETLPATVIEEIDENTVTVLLHYEDGSNLPVTIPKKSFIDGKVLFKPKNGLYFILGTKTFIKPWQKP